MPGPNALVADQLPFESSTNPDARCWNDFQDDFPNPSWRPPALQLAAQDQSRCPPQTIAEMQHRAQEKDKAVNVI